MYGNTQFSGNWLMIFNFQVKLWLCGSFAFFSPSAFFYLILDIHIMYYICYSGFSPDVSITSYNM